MNLVYKILFEFSDEYSSPRRWKNNILCHVKQFSCRSKYKIDFFFENFNVTQKTSKPSSKDDTKSVAYQLKKKINDFKSEMRIIFLLDSLWKRTFLGHSKDYFDRSEEVSLNHFSNYPQNHSQSISNHSFYNFLRIIFISALKRSYLRPASISGDLFN